jgi:hypothetical protein
MEAEREAMTKIAQADMQSTVEALAEAQRAIQTRTQLLTDANANYLELEV